LINKDYERTKKLMTTTKAVFVVEIYCKVFIQMTLNQDNISEYLICLRMASFIFNLHRVDSSVIKLF